MTKSAQDEAVEARGFHVVHEPDEADFALLRLKAPFDDRPGQFEKFFHAGSLEFLQQDKAQLDKILEKTCAIVDIYLNRPAVIPELVASAATVMLSTHPLSSNPSARTPIPASLGAMASELPVIAQLRGSKMILHWGLFVL
ncbi:hypothetical protein BKA60DRAFT_540847 [Fusarium oxysporum]|nr:hypothetical protein BKA60DRAFT_540847 [Fusarium oxysporum]